MLGGLFWLLFIRPQRRQQLAHSAMQDEVAVGDEIITAGGIHGEVVGDDGEILRVLIAPDVVVDLDRRAIAAVARDEDDDGLEEPADEAEEPSSERAREAR